MPSPTIEAFEAAVDRLTDDAQTQHDIIHGAADDPDVDTDNGPVKTLAKRLAEVGFGAFSSISIDADYNLVIVVGADTIKYAGVKLG